jgi:hypothetical protein
MPSLGMISRVALVRTDVSVERIVAIIKVSRTGERGTLEVTSNRSKLRRNTMYSSSSTILVTLIMEAIHSSETSVLTRATQRNIPEDGIPHSQSRENLISYKIFLYHLVVTSEILLKS